MTENERMNYFNSRVYEKFDCFKTETDKSMMFLLTEGCEFPPGCIPIYRDVETFLLAMRQIEKVSMVDYQIIKASKASAEEIKRSKKLVYESAQDIVEAYESQE